MPTFHFKCPKCEKFTYHAISNSCFNHADCMETSCEWCKAWITVVIDPIKCMSGKCISIGNQRCKKFKTIVVRPDKIDDF
jgi:hypothetical protein